jgi:uncharacterized protein involved in exopolysaccharide biosynthesis
MTALWIVLGVVAGIAAGAFGALLWFSDKISKNLWG